jgi:Protein of unknown function (DUF1595)
VTDLERRAYPSRRAPKNSAAVSDDQERGASFEQSIAVAGEAMLVSPHFLFRIESDPKPGPRAILASKPF